MVSAYLKQYEFISDWRPLSVMFEQLDAFNKTIPESNGPNVHLCTFAKCTFAKCTFVKSMYIQMYFVCTYKCTLYVHTNVLCMYIQMYFVCTNVLCLYKCTLYVQMYFVCTNVLCIYKCTLYVQISYFCHVFHVIVYTFDFCLQFSFLPLLYFEAFH